MQAIGGSGWAAGLGEIGETAMVAAAADGYTAIGTDGGFNTARPDGWAHISPGKVDYKGLEHFASNSLEDLSVLGKQVIASYYGQGPKFSYWNGCSQGGRQGFMLAQKYPTAFDGIVASAPAIRWTKLMVAGFWANVLQHEQEIGQYIEPCELNTLTEAAIKQCDPQDGVIDGLISDPASCKFDPYTLVGKPVSCAKGGTISKRAADLAQVGWYGFKASNQTFLQDGLTHEAFYTTSGAPLVGPYLSLLNVTLGCADRICDPDGKCRGKPNQMIEDWIKWYIKKDSAADLTMMLLKEYDEVFEQSVKEYTDIVGTGSVNLTAFHKAGGKIMSYHGLADPLIPSKNTKNYWEEVKNFDEKVLDYFRHYEAPGVGHCYGGNGLYPQSIFKSMVKWREEGTSPDFLPVDATQWISLGPKRERILCPYPQRSIYKGTGNIWSASSYQCGQ